MYDLNIIPIRHKNGKQLSEWPGFLAVNPPRRAVRSRADDILVLSLILSKDERLSSHEQSSLLEHLTQDFYKTPGSVTSALRALIETLNLTMMENNLKFARSGIATTGAINLAAIHRQSIYIVQSGLTHAYILTKQGLQHFYDASQMDRGLGLSRSPDLHYYQADLDQGGYLFMTDTPPETWTEDQLLQGTFPNLNQLRRRLLNQASADIRLDLVQILPGGGQINVIQPQPRQEQIDQEPIIEEQAETEADISELETSFEEDEPEVYPEETQEIVSEGLVTDEEEAIDHDHLEDEDIQGKDKVNETLNISETEEGSPLASVSPEESPISQETPVSNAIAEEQQEITLPKKKKTKLSKEAIELRREQLRERGLSGLSTFFDWWRNIREKGSQIIRDFIVRWSPGGTGSLPRLSRGTLLFIAIAVPIIVVAIAVGVYLARGQTMQYEYYYDQAENSVQNAMAADDPSVKRDLWGEAISYLDQAESLRETDEITLLRDQAEKAIDVLDGAVRLTYRPAIIGSLYSEINITRIISYGPDLYLLDATGGRVIHALRGSQGYEVDADFRCEMGNYTEGSINALVDMASLPINNPYQAHVMTIDAQGNIAFCGPGQDPVVQTLPKLDNPVGEITRITYDSNYLYALNPSGGNILVYRSTDSQFVETPTFYFEGEDLADKPDLSQIVDLAVNGPDLYLLRSDGLLVDCISSGLSDNPVSCQNPVEYVDGRAGKEDQPVTMPVGDYRSILFTTPPDPSISILDASNIDIYRFSLRFRLYQRLRSELGDYEIDSPTATAFTIGIDRFAFIAFGNQVFYAYIE